MLEKIAGIIEEKLGLGTDVYKLVMKLIKQYKVTCFYEKVMPYLSSKERSSLTIKLLQRQDVVISTERDNSGHQVDIFPLPVHDLARNQVL